MKKKTCTAPKKRRKFGKNTYSRSAKPMDKATANKRKKNNKGRGRIIKNPCGKGFYFYS